MTPARLIMTVFFLQAAGLSNWFPRIAAVQAKLGLDTGELGLIQLGMPIATVISAVGAGSLVSRFGARPILMLTLPLVSLSIMLPGWAFSGPSLFVALFLVGLSYPVVDIAMNVEANRIERVGGQRIMSTCHGCWSIGSVAGGLSAAAFAGAGIDPGWHLLTVALVLFPLAILVTRALPEVAAVPGEERVAFSLPSPGIVGLCLFLFGTLIVEAATRNWAAVYLTDVVGAEAAWGGIALGAFSFLMAIARFVGDRVVDRYGPVAVARTACLIAFAGILLVVVGTSTLQVVAGFAAAGFGIALGFPLSVTAAAARGDRPPAVNVATLQFFGVAAFLITPPLVGAIAEVSGLRIGMGVVLPLILMSVVLAGELRRRPT